MKKKKLLVILLSLVVILALVAPGCIPKKAETAQNPTDAERLAALESTVSQLQSKVASLPAPEDYGDEAELDQLRTDLDAIAGTSGLTPGEVIAALEARIATLELDSPGEDEESGGTARWGREVYALHYDTEGLYEGVEIHYSIKPTIVEEAGVYEIRLTLINTTTGPISDLVMEFDFTPKSGARVYVDGARTYFDTVAFPYILWDCEVVERGDDKYCRRIICLSDKIKLSGNPLYPRDYEVVTLKLEFTLAYE